MSRAALLLALLLFVGCGEDAVIHLRSDGGSDAGGGDAGPTGGGGGTSFDAGGCEVAPAFAQGDLVGKPGFELASAMGPAFNYATMRRPSAANAMRTDVMFNDFYGAAPLSNVAIPATNYELCQYCLVIQTSCDVAGASCSKGYLAQSGTLSVSAASKEVDAGSYAFQLSNVRYQAWDFANDVPLDAGCLALGNFAFTGAWP